LWMGPDYLRLFNIHLDSPEQERMLLLALPVGVGILGLYQVLVYLLIRYKHYRALAGSKVASGGVTVVTQLGLGTLDSGGWGLIVGWILGRLAAIGVCLGAERGAARARKAPRFPGWRTIGRAMRRFVRFPLLTMPAGLMNALAVELPLLLSASLFGPQITGWFSFARRIVYGPMSLVGRSVSQVYVGALSEAINRRDRSALRLFDRLSRRLFLMAVGPFLLLALLAPWLFGWIFGPAWYASGVLVRYLSPAYLVHFVVVPLSQTLNLVERQDWQIGWDLTRLLLVAGVFFLAKSLAWNFVYTFAAYSLVSMLMYLAFYFLMRRALLQRVQS
ncbi:MAG: oligosaccharide flippase family protein, partial [Chloroflexi bacterium]|nr:oligosaccharide flippase family protein [Chloroflexota bacterium]